MSGDEYPMTTGARELRSLGIPFRPMLYEWEEHGGTAAAAHALSYPEHAVIKTLVLETDAHACILLLMLGDREASMQKMARAIGARHVELSSESEAKRKTGYMFGGTSPFGTRTKLPVYAERTIFTLPRVLINGGKRGFLVEIDPADLRKAFPVTEVEVTE